MRPIDPNPIVVLGSGVPAPTPASIPPKTIQWNGLEGPPVSPTVLDSREPGSTRNVGVALTNALTNLATEERSDRGGFAAMRSLTRTRGETRTWVEEAETMRLPPGAAEDMLELDELPAGSVCARIATTRLSRDLAREYRERYGVALTVDAAGIRAMQHHLLRRLARARSEEASAGVPNAELTRHGAFLGEILARRLGAEWVELGDTHPTDWTMRVPRGGRVWPVWRVHNFLRQRWDGRGALLALYEHLRARALAPVTASP